MVTVANRRPKLPKDKVDGFEKFREKLDRFIV
jgi:hypothetical protein